MLNKRYGAALFLALLIAPLFTFAAPGVPRMLNYQGRLLSSGGALLGGTGTEYCFKFSLYDTQTVGGGTKLWPAGSPSTMTATVRNGVFTLGIGDTNIGGDVLDFNFQDTDTAYLNVEVAAKVGATCAPGDGAESFETLSPRQRILASGYAINASMVGGFSAAQYASGNQIPVLSTGNLILGGTNPFINATTSNTLTLQGGGEATGDIQFFSSANKITAAGNATFAGNVTAASSTITNATSTTLFSAIGRFTSLIADALVAAVATITDLTATNFTATNATTTSATSTSMFAAALSSLSGLFGDIVATSSVDLASTTAQGRLITGNIVATSTATSSFAGPVRVGLNTSSYKFSILGSTTAATSATGTAVLAVSNSNPTLSSGTNVLRLNLRTAFGTTCTSASTCPRFIEYFSGVGDNADTGGRGVGSLRLSTAGTGITQTSGAADFAEYMVLNSAASVGDLVSLNANGEYQRAVAGQSLIGVVSDNPAFVGNANLEGEPNAYVVGFAGVIETTVSDTNGAIGAGDFIAASTTAGVGVKLVGSGFTVGQALEAWSGPGTGQIAVLVFPKYIDAAVVLEHYGGVQGGISGYWDFSTTTGAITLASSSYALALTNKLTLDNASATAISANYASSTQGFFGSLSVGNLSGILRATGGAIASTLVNLASDVTGILGISNGGTGTSTAPSQGQLLVGNASGGYDLIATSSLGITGTFSTTSASYFSAQGLAFSTTSNDYWKSLNNFFSTTSADYYISQANLSGFSTTSADYWKIVNNFFSTTSADYYLAQNQGAAFSTSSTDYWETQQTARSADDLTNNSIEELSDVAPMTENYGDLFAWNGSAWTDFATSTLGIALGDTTGTLAADRGGTGLSSIAAAGILIGNYAGTGWQQLSTSTLGMLSTHVTEGTNLYYQDARVLAYLNTFDKGYFFGTTSAQYFLTQNQGAAFSTTSASNFVNQGLAFSTTSSDYWKSVNNFFSTTSAQYFASATDLFSTTSANYFAASSTTIPKTYTANTFTELQTFGNASTTNISASYASSTQGFFGSLSIGNLGGILRATAGAVTSTFVDLAADVTGFLGVTNGGTGTSTAPSYGQVLVGNAVGGYDLIATSSLGIVGGGSSIAYLFPGDATTTPLTFSGGLFASSSVLFGNAGASSLFFDGASGKLGLGSSTPSAKLSIQAFDGDGASSLFAIASSSGGTTRNLFSVDRDGVATIGDAAGTGDATFQFGSDVNAWSMGFNTADKSFRIASSTNLSTDVMLTIAKSGVVTFNTGAAIPALANCTQALETDVSGNIVCGTDVAGGGGGSGAWATTTDSLAVYVADPSDVVIVGATATSTTGNIFEVVGNTLLRGAATSYGIFTAPRFVATSSVASVFPYASTTALSATTLCLSSDCRSSWGDGFSTTSALHFSSLGLAFSTTSNDHWQSQRNFFSTTSASNFASAGLAFSTTSNDYWKSINNFFSTTSADYWKTQSDFFSTTSIAYYNSVTDLFSTTSANFFVASSSTIPKTYTANVFSALQTFENASTTNISATYASSTEGFFGSLSIGNLSGILRATAGAITSTLVNLASDVTGILGISNGGTGTSTAPVYGQLLLGNDLGGYDFVATSSLGINLADTTGVLSEAQGGTGESTYVLGDILYSTGAGALSRLPIGNAGEVLKVTGGLPAWGVDLSGGGGGGIVGAWSTTTNELAIYPANSSHIVLVGSGSTSTDSSIFEVTGRSYFSTRVGIGTTSPGSLLSIENVANFGSGGSTLYSSLSVPSLSVGSLTGILRASAGAVTASLIDLANDVSGILQVANGGTGWDTIEAGTLLTGNGTGAVATTTIDSSLQLGGGTLALNTNNPNIWTGFQAFSFASSTVFSAGRAYFGETATTTIDTAGNVAVAGTLNVTGATQASALTVSGNTTLSAATTTNLLVTASSTFQDFTSRNATSSILYTGAFRGAGLSGCDTAGDKLLWNSLTGEFSCGTDVSGGASITSLGAAGQLQTGATQTFASSSDANIGITITSAGDQHTFAMNWLGTLSVQRGGTGWGNITAGTLLTGNGTGALATTTVGSSLELSGGALSLNLANANLWNGLQRFGSGASTTALSANDFVAVGRTATTTIRGEANATSTFAGGVDASRLNTSATSTLAGVRLTNITNCTQALETNASGDVVCGTDTGADGVIITTFTAGGTWTKADYPGISFTQVIVTAGGASGGTADSSDGATVEEAAGGGGAGGTSISMISAASLGTTESVLVGLGGASNATAGNGINGGNSSFGTHASSTGGGAGLGDSTLDSTTPEGWGGGAGGATTTALGDIRLAGGDGDPGTAVAADVSGGTGGASYWGGGGRGGHTTATPQAANGANGIAYGSGGGGGAIEDTTTAGVGGKGGDGVVVTMNYTSSAGDLAEWYETKDDVEAGDVVAISTDLYEYDSKLGLQKSAILEKATSLASVVGVVSSAPYETIGMDILAKSTHPRPVALAGRVPVKASLENGDIKAGDLLTVSSIPGVAMRATKAGVTIGRALEDAVCPTSGGSASSSPMQDRTGEVCTVLVIVNTSYTTGALLNIAFRDLGMDTDTISTELDYSKMILAEMMQQKKNITASTTLSEMLTDRLAAGLEVITPRVVTDTVVANVIQPLENDVRIQLDDGTFVIERRAHATTTLSFDSASTTSATSSRALSIDALGNAVFAGAITGADFIVGTREKPGGITMYDTDTGEPYCARIVYGRLETFAGECAELVDLFGATKPAEGSGPTDESPTPAVEESTPDGEPEVVVTEESAPETPPDTAETTSVDELSQPAETAADSESAPASEPEPQLAPESEPVPAPMPEPSPEVASEEAPAS